MDKLIPTLTPKIRASPLGEVFESSRVHIPYILCCIRFSGRCVFELEDSRRHLPKELGLSAKCSPRCQ